jgi:hypothetical protein
LYLAPVTGEPLLASLFVAVKFPASFQVGNEVWAGDIFQFEGNDAVGDEPILSKFSATGDVSGIEICAHVLLGAIINKHKKTIPIKRNPGKRKLPGKGRMVKIVFIQSFFRHTNSKRGTTD